MDLDGEERGCLSRVAIKSNPSRIPSKIMLRKKATPLGINKSGGNDAPSHVKAIPDTPSPKIAYMGNNASKPSSSTNKLVSKGTVNSAPIKVDRQNPSPRFRSRSASLSPVRSFQSASTAKVKPPWSSPSITLVSPTSKSANGSPSGYGDSRTIWPRSKPSPIRSLSAKKLHSTTPTSVRETVGEISPPIQPMLPNPQQIPSTSREQRNLKPRGAISWDPLYYFSPRIPRDASPEPDLCDKLTNLDMESKVRTMIKFNALRARSLPSRHNKGPKSVHWDPSVVFCSPQTEEKSQKPDVPSSKDKVQDILDTVSTLKNIDRLQFQILLSSLKEIDSDESTTPSIEGTMGSDNAESLDRTIKKASSALADYASLDTGSRLHLEEETENNGNFRTNSTQESTSPSSSSDHGSFFGRDRSPEQINQERLFERMRLFQKGCSGAGVMNSAECGGYTETVDDIECLEAIDEETEVTKDACADRLRSHGQILEGEGRQKLQLIEQSLRQRRRRYQFSSSDIQSTDATEMTAYVRRSTALPLQLSTNGNDQGYLDSQKKNNADIPASDTKRERTGSHRKGSIQRNHGIAVKEHALNPAATPFSWLQDSYFRTRKVILGRERSMVSAPDVPDPDPVPDWDDRRERSTASAPETQTVWECCSSHMKDARPNPARWEPNHTHSTSRDDVAPRDSTDVAYDGEQPDQELLSPSKDFLYLQAASRQNTPRHMPAIPTNVLNSNKGYQRGRFFNTVDSNARSKSGDLIRKETDKIIQYFGHLARATMNIVVLRGHAMRDQSWRELAKLTLQPPTNRLSSVAQAAARITSELRDPLQAAIENLNRLPMHSAKSKTQRSITSTKIDTALKLNASGDRIIKQDATKVRRTHRFESSDCDVPNFVPQATTFKDDVVLPVSYESHQQSFWPEFAQQPFYTRVSYSPYHHPSHQPYPEYNQTPYGLTAPFIENVPSWPPIIHTPERRVAYKEREATALPEGWANSLIDTFAHRYPMTGTLRTHPLVPPGFEMHKETPHTIPVDQRRSIDSNASDIQQKLEVLLLRKKEKGAHGNSNMGRRTYPRKTSGSRRMIYEQRHEQPVLAHTFYSNPASWMGSHLSTQPFNYWPIMPLDPL